MRPDPMSSTARSLTPSEIAARYRVSADKVRAWIRRGELTAVNVAAVLSGKAQFVVTPESLAEFESRRNPAQPKPAPRRRKKALTFYADGDGE